MPMTHPASRLGTWFGFTRRKSGDRPAPLLIHSGLSGASPHQRKRSRGRGTVIAENARNGGHHSLLTSHFSHLNAFPWLQDLNLRFAFGETGKLFRVTH